MLEIKHLTKVYKTKGGNDTKALDDVSINFEETGLVFLLGKSGSGKSTLLNLAGGLDAPTSGEVVVMGKSSKDFTGSDFDSYRNTFVGFIFQEYNVLNEFSVEDNIALALELQGKPKDKQKIAELLASVELEQFAKRKPNTLSGGQKQRIAIARALVKDPQIIMADEPTGALDSATGRQVFETLKQLSESRLVIVVSHDREFAEIYGDRIVELKDGKIISDVTKKKTTPKKLDENVTLIGENTLAVKSGEQLTEANFLTIKKFLSESGGSVVLTKGEKEIADFKRATRMDDDGAREHFEDTQEAELNIKHYETDQTRFIRSRLPAAKAIRIGASGLKLKPFRLVLTIFLSIVAFVMFGLFSTMMVYDADEVLINSFMKSDYEYVALSKQYKIDATFTYPDGDSYTYHTQRDTQFTPAEVEKFSQFGAAVGAYSYSATISNVNVVNQYKNYYFAQINTVAEATENNPFASKLLYGAFPTESNEICISSYLLECIQNAQFRVVDEKGNVSSGTAAIEIKSAEELIGKYLATYSGAFKVTGIFDSGSIPAKYNKIKEGESERNYYNYLSQSPHVLVFVSSKFIEENKSQLTSNNEYVQYFDSCADTITLTSGEKLDDREHNSINLYDGIQVYDGNSEPLLPITFFGEEKTTLADNELILPLRFFRSVQYESPEPDIPKPDISEPDIPEPDIQEPDIQEPDIQEPDISDYYDEETDGYKYDEYSAALHAYNAAWDAYREAYNEAWDAYHTAYNEAWDAYHTAYNEAWNAYDAAWDAYYDAYNAACDAESERIENAFRIVCEHQYYEPIMDENNNTTGWERKNATGEQIAQALALVTEHVKAHDEYKKAGMFLGEYNYLGEFNVVGFFKERIGDFSYDGVYCAQSVYDKAEVYKYNDETIVTKYQKEEDACYSTVFIPLSKDEATFETLVALLGKNHVNEQTDVFYEMENVLYESVQLVNSTVDTLSTVFLWVGIVLALFAALLLFNFISMSISNKKREIGILRAVGARGTDVFKIFFSESGIIVGICTVLSLIGSFVLTGVINGILKSDVGLDVTLFMFGGLSVLMMVGVALVVAFVSTFFPVYFASKKKPVDSIRAL